MIGGVFFDDSAMYEPPGSEKLAKDLFRVPPEIFGPVVF
jgi:hypothetical protein